MTTHRGTFSRFAAILTISLFRIAYSAAAQQAADPPAPPAVDTLQTNATRLYLDCWACDFDYTRREIGFVNFVRDPEQADVHVYITTRGTASGGREYTFVYLGKKSFAGRNDTAQFALPQIYTADMTRRELVRRLKLGLVPYVAKTLLSDFLHLEYSREAPPAPIEDPWNFWVFRVGMSTNVSGERNRNFQNYWTDLSASRVTEEWKTNFGFSMSYDDSRFRIDEGFYRSISRSQNLWSLIVRSLNDHWSLGGMANASASTYSNIELALSGALAVEYDYFPYSESTRRQLRVQYRVSAGRNRYVDETIYDRMEETLFSELLTASYITKHPWGSYQVSLTGSHYYHDPSKYRLQFDSDFYINLFEGFSLHLYCNLSSVHDQLSLVKGVATPEEILLRKSQLATSYSYRASAGISYLFGSIFNNIVNPRF